jgi:glyoxylase-like metal-dependent hydrolase (beta-lactamase superfamily II)
MTAEHTRTWNIGNVEVTRIVELNAVPTPLALLLEGGSRELANQYDWLFPHFATPEGDALVSFQSFVLKTPTRRIVIDTCFGNDHVNEHEMFSNLQTSFLKDLERAGFPPETIDTVLCTHLHPDHVGWNTRKVGDKWLPTFPNARYLLGRKEWDFWKEIPRDGNISSRHLEEAVYPVIDAGLADFIGPNHQICQEVDLFPTPGHTPGHVSVRIRSEGQEAIITGDVMHHPVQIARPDLRCNICMEKDLACDTRKDFVNRFGDSNALIIGSHFSDPTAGRIERDGDHWRFTSNE